jgi:hypothetical protein
MITPVSSIFCIFLSGVVYLNFTVLIWFVFLFPSSKMRRGSDFCIICDAHLRRDIDHGKSSFDYNIDELLGFSINT